MSEDFLDRLSRWASGVAPDALPPAVLSRASLVIADSIGVMVSGMQYPEMRAFIDRPLAVRSSGAASIVGAKRRTDPSTAALLNGTAGTWMDMNEGNLHARGHPGIQVIPIAFALAEQERKSGAELLAAVVAGYEVGSRIKRASATRFALHPHGTFGAIGAAVAVARLMGYEAQAMRNIINVSATLGLATSRSTLMHGATVRNVYTGMSGVMGLLAHQMVQCGFTGEPDGVTPVYGSVYADRFDPEFAARGVGEEFYLPRGFIKLHPCGRYIHGALDLIEALMAERALEPERIRAISVRTYAMAVSLGHQIVTSSFGARFSLPFAMAALIVNGRARLDNYAMSAVENPRIQALARKVHVVEEPAWTAVFPEKQPTEITVTLDDGSAHQRASDYHRGEAENPHPAELIRAKFLGLAGPVWGAARAASRYDQLLALGQVADVSALASAEPW